MAISCSQEMMTARVVGIRYDSDRKNATNTGQKMTFFAHNFCSLSILFNRFTFLAPEGVGLSPVSRR
jgi:hypothetical protein